MIHIQLPQGEVKRLEQLFRSTNNRKLRDRLQIILLAQRGRLHQDIAAELCINRRSVQRWLNAYCERGLEGLTPRKAKGAPGKIPVTLADEIRRWVIEGPAKQGLDRANWTYEELADHLFKTQRIKTSRSAMHRFCSRIDIRPYRPTYRFLRGDPVKQAKAREDLTAFTKQAAVGEVVLLSQDEARFQMVPTLAATLGVKGHRPVVGTRDCKDILYVFAVLNLISGALHSNTLESLQADNRKNEESKTRRMQRAFAEHLRHVGRMYPQAKHKRVVLTIDNAPWHRGKLIDEALKENPHLEFYRMPSYSPQLNVIERFWKVLRRRATHNRLFDAVADLKKSIRTNLSYFQTVRKRVLTLIKGRRKKAVK
jgi:transposase